MKRTLIYIVVLAAALMIPQEGTDVGKLLPVELVHLYYIEDQLAIETDTGDLGRGATVEVALQDLKDTTAGMVFLDTADYLLVSERALGEITEVRRFLKTSVRVCMAEPGIDLTAAAEFLAVHKPAATLKNGGKPLQKLKLENDRMFLE